MGPTRHSYARASTQGLALVVMLILVLAAGGASRQAAAGPDDSGLILRTLPLPTANPGDLAWDGEALWTTLRANENWTDYPRLFRVKVLKLRTD